VEDIDPVCEFVAAAGAAIAGATTLRCVIVSGEALDSALLPTIASSSRTANTNGQTGCQASLRDPIISSI